MNRFAFDRNLIKYLTAHFLFLRGVLLVFIPNSYKPYAIADSRSVWGNLQIFINHCPGNCSIWGHKEKILQTIFRNWEKFSSLRLLFLQIKTKYKINYRTLHRIFIRRLFLNKLKEKWIFSNFSDLACCLSVSCLLG